MYTIKVETSFSSAHNLRGYKGKCEELHGHNWKVEATVTTDELDKIGMVLDFNYLKTELNKIIEKLDHKYLNNIPYFSAAGGSASGGKKVNPVRNTKAIRRQDKISNGINPTSENIAKYIYDRLAAEVSGLRSVTVWENSASCATYEG